MKVLVTGATGFTGSYTLPQLLATGAELRCYGKPTSAHARLVEPLIEWIDGDITDVARLRAALVGVDAVINIVSLGFGYAPGIVQAVQHSGVKRAIFLSTTAIFTRLNAPSKQIRLAAEKTVTTSNLHYTILRPTMIYGSPRDRNMCRLIRFIQRTTVIPVIGSGNFLQQPVYVEDIAQAIVQSLMCERAVGKTYEVAGGTALTYNEVINTISRLMDKSIIKVHLPVKPIVGALRFTERAKIRLPIKAEQIERLNEDKAFAFTLASQDFGYQPRSFAEGIALELAAMGLSKPKI